MEIIEVIGSTGGTLGLAIFSIWMLNKVWELRLEEVKRYADELKQMNCEMKEAINRNTEAWVKMMERVRN
jgi:hypothetical protein